MKKKINVALLLGAGASIPAGYPSTEALTRLILSGENVRYHTDQAFYLEDAPQGGCEYVKLSIEAVTVLIGEIEGFYKKFFGRAPNYEEIYYVASQFSDFQTGELDNPALQRISQFIEKEFGALVDKANVEGVSKALDIAVLTQKYICDIVWRSLSSPSRSTAHLDCIVQLLSSKIFNRTALISLCHDTHVEMYAQEKGIELIDGFTQPRRGVRYWNASSLRKRTQHPAYLKLHGSVNWFRFRPLNGDWWDERVGIPIGRDFRHTESTRGTPQMPLSWEPIILMGTFNKISRYASEIFIDLHFRAKYFLERTDLLAISGYSFGDKGINALILNWLYGGRRRRVLVIHKFPDALASNSRPAVRTKWANLVSAGKIVVLQKFLGEVGASELVEALSG